MESCLDSKNVLIGKRKIRPRYTNYLGQNVLISNIYDGENGELGKSGKRSRKNNNFSKRRERLQRSSKDKVERYCHSPDSDLDSHYSSLLKSEDGGDVQEFECKEVVASNKRKALRSSFRSKNNASVSTIEHIHPSPISSKSRIATSKNTRCSRENRRLYHNEAMRADKADAERRRKLFVEANWDHLKHFMEEKPKTKHSRSKTLSSPTKIICTLEEQPKCLRNVFLRDYQLSGLNWLIKAYESGISVILGDEMGLGKTLQTIAYLGWMKFSVNISGPFLIIVPLSVISNWINEFKRFLPQMRVLMLHSSDTQEKERLRKDVLPNLLDSYDVVVTTYDMAKHSSMKHSLVESLYWRVVVLDEGHVVKNENTIIARTVRKMHFEQALILTGTPLQNNLHELWALLNFLQPELFPKPDLFDECFDIKQGKSYKVNKDLLLKVHSLLKPFMLRRIKVDVEKTVPPKVEKKILCPLSATQSLWYKRFLLKDSSLLTGLELIECNRPAVSTGSVQGSQSSQEQIRWRRLQMLLVQLRKVCNHPFLFEEADPHPTFTDDSIIEASGKVQVLDKLLCKLKSEGHRVVLFSQFTGVLDILEDFLSFRGHQYCRLDGGTNRVRRQININSFNHPQSPLFAFLMSTRAGGLGVNLQTADTVILYDSDWNPQADLQAMARVHRIGQEKTVHVYRLVSAGTVEERIVHRAEKKLYLDQIVNRDGVRGIQDNVEDDLDALDSKELLQMLKFGANIICQSTGTELDDKDIDDIVRRAEIGDSAASSAEQEVVQVDHRHTALEYDPSTEPVDTRHFQGKRYDKYGPTCVPQSSNGGNNPGSLPMKRKSIERLVTIVDDKGEEHRVFKDNVYDIEKGMTSVYDREYAHDSSMREKATSSKRKMYRAGVDFDNEDFCLDCWDGGDLACCDRCPASYHLSCLPKALRPNSSGRGLWSCPLHHCTVCGRTTSQAGGLLFRCTECPKGSSCYFHHAIFKNCTLQAFCEDHFPAHAFIVNNCDRLEKTCDYTTPHNTCYIRCSHDCAEWAKSYDIESLMGDDVKTNGSSIKGNRSTASQDVSTSEVMDAVSVEVQNEVAETSDHSVSVRGKETSKLPAFGSLMSSCESSFDLSKTKAVELQLALRQLPTCLAWVRCQGCGSIHSAQSCPSNFSMVKDMEDNDVLTLQQCEEKILLALVNQSNYCRKCKTIIKGSGMAFLDHLRVCCDGRSSIESSEYGFRVQDVYSKHSSVPTFRWMNYLPRFGESIISLLEKKILFVKHLPNQHTCINISPQSVSMALSLADCGDCGEASTASTGHYVESREQVEEFELTARAMRECVLSLLQYPRLVALQREPSNGASDAYAWGGYYKYRPFATSLFILIHALKCNITLLSCSKAVLQMNNFMSLLHETVSTLYDEKKIDFLHPKTMKILNKGSADDIIESSDWEEDKHSIVICLKSQSKLAHQYESDHKIEEFFKQKLLTLLSVSNRLEKSEVELYIKSLINCNQCSEMKQRIPVHTSIPLLEYYLHPVFELETRSVSALALSLVDTLATEGRLLLTSRCDSFVISKSTEMVHEDYCLNCADGGDLVCCDFCPAAYHLECIPENLLPVSLESDDNEIEWLCPRHYCSICGISDFEAEKDYQVNVNLVTRHVFHCSSFLGVKFFCSSSSSSSSLKESSVQDNSRRMSVTLLKKNGAVGVTLGRTDGEYLEIESIKPGYPADGLLLESDFVLGINDIQSNSSNFSKLVTECKEKNVLTFHLQRNDPNGVNYKKQLNTSLISSSKSFHFLFCTDCTNSYCWKHVPTHCEGIQQNSMKYADTWERVRISCNFSAPRNVKYRPCCFKCRQDHDARKN